MKTVQENIEKNSASYQHQVIEKKKPNEYNLFKEEINRLSEIVKTQKECIGLVSYYLSFIKDSHQWIAVTDEYYPFSTFADSTAVKKFILENVENISPTRDMPAQDEIEGQWYYKGGMLEIRIQKNNDKGRKYVGLVTKPIQYYAKKGDLKIEFYLHGNQLYAVFWNFGQRPKTYPVYLKDNTLMIGHDYVFIRHKDIVASNDFQLKDSTYFEALNDRTAYLRIYSFSYDELNNIDSILEANHNIIISKRNLIIDIRNNSGGSDLSYHPILPYIMKKRKYTMPIKSDIWISEDNLRNFDSKKYLYGVVSKKDSINAEKRIRILAKHVGEFSTSNFNIVKLPITYKYPENVFIITNKQVASSAEGFVLTAKQSSKVKVVGKNTAGVISYGDWRKVELPDFPAWISITQKKMTFHKYTDLEMEGIQPDIILKRNEAYWKEIALDLIEKIN
ncbi:S41 family peptidase [Flavobacterium sp. MFBS3-15]|uniref:S41 family peptidase n=1 Tax=Flavobacterium sp. MFBS3-15 TaxID=2989816 RepID=UPI002236719C|nr:S41 family peptidase [Flavobacterium sp. MFBS3-15]MCW4469778.1 S41 family peptidase [Flavobacterium sp. MFBS3-15]